MKRVILESPYAGDVDRNLAYLRAAMNDCIKREWAPFAGHGLYTQPGVLDDTNVNERLLGTLASQSWYEVAELCVVYTDLGFSDGMLEGIEVASLASLEIKFCTVKGWAGKND